MRIALADDSNLFRRGLRSLVTAVGVEVAFEARDPSALLTLVEAGPPDAVIVDIRMPPTFTDEGLVVAETLTARYPEMGVLVLSTYNETAYAVRLLEGCGQGIGYLLKDRVDDVSVLVDALERICAGQSVIDPDIVVRLIAQHRRVDKMAELTTRERDVLAHMAQGRSNAGIGQALGLSARTVEAYVASVFQKLRLPAGEDDNRRILAVLTWLRATAQKT
jgi:DNA-binding NarL/FixJ family response regulator